MADAGDRVTTRKHLRQRIAAASLTDEMRSMRIADETEWALLEFARLPADQQQVFLAFAGLFSEVVVPA